MSITNGFPMGGGSIKVDSTLSTTSTNPVQNKIVASNVNSLSTRITSLENEMASVVVYGATLSGNVFSVTASKASLTSGQILKISTPYITASNLLPVFNNSYRGSYTSASNDLGTFGLYGQGGSSDIYPGNAADGDKTDYADNPPYDFIFPTTIKVLSIKLWASDDNGATAEILTSTDYGGTFVTAGSKTIHNSSSYDQGILTWSFDKSPISAIRVRGSNSDMRVNDLQVTSYVNILRNPTLNLNGTGVKTINGYIECGQSYTLMYNGSSWDITTT